MKEENNARLEYYREKILIQLANAYRRSKKDSGTNVIRRRTMTKPEKFYRQYRQNDGELAEIDALNEAAESCRRMGFLNYSRKRFSNEIETIYLEDRKIEEVEAYLKKHYGYEPKKDKAEAVREIIRQYRGKSPAADQICEELQAVLDKNQIPPQYEQTREVLKALVFIENNTRHLYLREASMMIYGSSKYLEEKTMDAVCRRLRNYLKRPCASDEMPGEILEEYGIYPEQQRLCIKGNMTLEKCGKEADIAMFPGGIEFAADELPDIGKITVKAVRFITVENKTSYFRCSDKESVFFYLGGYANRIQRDFLKKVIADNPQLEFLHFGDIDAGGLYIHEHLCRMTGAAFGLWHMSVKELSAPGCAGCLQKLTPRDRRRLQALAQKEQYQELAEYMLEKNVKLEQEIVSLELSGEE